MPIYIYKGNSQISTNAVRNDKAVKAIYAKEQGKDAVCVWGIDTSIPYDQMFAYSIVNNKINITGLESNVKSNYITIPNKISDKLVTSIETAAFRDQNKILSITVPDSVTSVGAEAFSGCASLTSITGSTTNASTVAQQAQSNSFAVNITSGTSIDDRSFSGCTGLMSITIPESVTSIGYQAFYNCSKLTSITIPDSVTSFGSEAFSGCTSITSIIGSAINANKVALQAKSNFFTVNITSGTSIRDYDFRYCTGLTSITIPDSVTSIGLSAFSGCTGLTSITIPGSVTSVDTEAFSGCTGLTSVTIGNGATNIGTNAFLGCTNLMRVTLGNGAKNIGKRAFWKCTSLTSVTIGNGTKSIDDSVFGDCYNLTDITIPDSVESISGTALSDTAWYDNQPNGLVYAGQVFYKYKGRMPSNTSVTLREGTLGISDDACYDCAGLTSITIPDSVTNIRSRAFSYCKGLTSIIFTGTRAQWNAISKGTSWNSNTGNYTIHCTDGDLPKS